MACKAGKWRGELHGNGNKAWHPRDMPGPLLALQPEAIPDVGSRLKRRPWAANIGTIAGLLATAPKQMRALWDNVTVNTAEIKRCSSPWLVQQGLSVRWPHLENRVKLEQITWI